MKMIPIYCIFFLLLQSVVGYPLNEGSNGLFENNMENFQTLTDNDTNVLQAARRMTGKWPNGKVPFSFSYQYDYSMQSKVIRAMNEIESKTCIDFVRRTLESDYIKFTHNLEYCQSYIGKIGGEQKILLNDACLNIHDDILHELMHALGFVHEQNRHDRDDHIIINWSNVNIIGGRDIDWQKRSHWELEYFGTKYDYKSVMHYPSVVRGYTVITPIEYDAYIGSNGLSVNDIYRINKHYGCQQLTNVKDDNDNTAEPTAYPCVENAYYCGSELRKKNFKNVLSDNFLYYCENTRKAKYLRDCRNGCLAESKSRCACKVNERYCGYELANKNWDKYFSHNIDTLYECDNGRSVSELYTCLGTCKESSPSYCQDSISFCKPFLDYCGYEIGKYIKSTEPVPINNLYYCSSDQKQFNLLRYCENGCLMNGSENSYCSTVNRVAYIN